MLIIPTFINWSDRCLFALSRKVFVSIAVLIISVIGSEDKLFTTFTLGVLYLQEGPCPPSFFSVVFQHPGRLLYLQ